MKKKNNGKLNLEKLTVSRLNNPHNIRGGNAGGDGTDKDKPVVEVCILTSEVKIQVNEE